MHAYLDNSATTKPYDEVIDYMSEMMKFHYGNPSSMHRIGVDAELKIKQIKQSILKSLHVTDGEILFTSGGTEANNLAILGTAGIIQKRRPEVITIVTEHKSVLAPMKVLEERGHTVTYVSVDARGRVDVESVLAAITPRTGLISMMMVNNETGTIQPIEALCKALKKLKEPPVLHVDAVQAYGKMPIELKRLGIDLLTASGHKIHGPKGIGFLYVKKGVRLNPIIFGGGQQHDIRPGTENTYGIYGLSKAVDLQFSDLKGRMAYMNGLKARFMDRMAQAVPEAVCHSVLEDAPHIVNMSFPGIRGEVLLHQLESQGVFVSTGSACNSKNKQYSHVLQAMGLTQPQMESAIRFSFSVMNTESEIDYAVEQVKGAYESLYAIIKGR